MENPVEYCFVLREMIKGFISKHFPWVSCHYEISRDPSKGISTLHVVYRKRGLEGGLFDFKISNDIKTKFLFVFPGVEIILPGREISNFQDFFKESGFDIRKYP